MSAYLFVHFREKTTPDGEQVYFGLSRDGYHWEAVNGGSPVLWCYYGDRGARDFTICRNRLDGSFVIAATDLSLSYGMRGKYNHSWKNVGRNGSKCLSFWYSDNLTDWTEQRLIRLGDESFGCLWAPDIIFDEKAGDYILHWSSTHASNDYGDMAIFYSRTKDFKTFTAPQELYRKEDCGVIDSAMYEEGGKYYLFVKSDRNPSGMILLEADSPTGPFVRLTAFDESTRAVQNGLYEAPTAVRAADGRWCLFLDFYGAAGAAQGYVPFVSDSLASGAFRRADGDFSFPYGFKHGTILAITDEEYERIKNHDWSDKGYINGI